MKTYRALDAHKIEQTLDELTFRIEERFPGAGLAGVCSELSNIARETSRRVEVVQRPMIWLRLIVGGLLLLGLFALATVAGVIEFKRTTSDALGVLTGLDAAFNVVVLMGAAVFFLITVEERVKRRQVLADLHELRAIVHVVDMHQLTKDPSALLKGNSPTAHSPKREMTEYQLARYLDYCTEMLSLTAKVAALYAQSFRDPVVVANVNEIEQLTTNLSRKVWQKIMLLKDHTLTDG